MTQKYRINLFQDELIPDTPLLTLPRVLWLWFIIAIMMFGLVSLFNYQESTLGSQATDVQSQKRQQDEKIEQLKQALADHKPNAQLTARLATLQDLIANKKNVYGYLTNSEESYIDGFAKAMSDLALVHNSNISLTSISIDEQQISFGGVARTADAVPAWLSKFEQSKVLSGRLFNHFELSENESQLIEFSVSSNTPKEQP